jgi:hypothetical protein
VLAFSDCGVDNCNTPFLTWELRAPKTPEERINDALDHAAPLGFVVEQTPAGHKWGRIKCTCRAAFSVWSMPKIPFNHGTDPQMG